MGSTSELTFPELLAKYEQEQQKRPHPSTHDESFVDIGKADQFKHFNKDPWKTVDNPYLSAPSPVKNGDHTKILIVGAGFGALLFAVRFIETGYAAEDILLVDSTWGFGGCWYWNRYPGLMCDVESACYMPLLEETGYIPKHRYSYGLELRAYAELVAAKWRLAERALFGATVQKTVWNNETAEWVTTIIKESVQGLCTSLDTMQIRSDLFVLASGTLSRPKLPRLDGLAGFKGHMFHTSRWDYEYTGGTPEDPRMENLRNKRVAFLGTGATGVQVVPQLAKWAKELIVLQRTPSAVDIRGQKPVDAEEWTREFHGRPGWQRERRENMAAFLSNVPDLPSVNIVNDGWTNFPSISALCGSPRAAVLTEANIAEYIHMIHRLDLPRQESIRHRVTDIVKDPTTASRLQPWYPGWFRRPCFHDEYLHTFNLPNVSLADTDGHGIDGFTEHGVLCNGQELHADVIIFGTGFEPFNRGSPAFRAGITITGRNGLSMDDKWSQRQGPATLHGIITHGFPNLFFPGVVQAAATVNILHGEDLLATHTAGILRAARERVVGDGGKFIIEPTEEAEEEWAMRVATGAYGFAAAAQSAGLTGPVRRTTGDDDCADIVYMRTPAVNKHEDVLKMARGLPWSRGILDFTAVLEEWKNRGDLKGLDICVL
ncbi:hypothetical protein FQN51_004070 [Onygenales sp. PD_10]|nr:hypothetical protein FQN51_004070 [Onygenales sp. PD_10]